MKINVVSVSDSHYSDFLSPFSVNSHLSLTGDANILVMSPLRRYIFVCFMAKSAFLGGGGFGPSSVKRGQTHIVL